MRRLIIILFSTFLFNCSTINNKEKSDKLENSKYNPIISGQVKADTVNIYPIYIVNSVVISDQNRIEILIKNYSAYMHAVKYLNEIEAYSKYKIKSEDGIIVTRIKRNIIIKLDD